MSTERCKYIIAETRKDTKQTWYVCARPGFYRTADGKQKRDGTGPIKGGPEHTLNRNHALEFKSCRAAMRVRNLCPSAKVHPV